MKAKLKLIQLIIVSLFFVFTSNAQNYFSNEIIISANNGAPRETVPIDVNNDGYIDLVSVSSNDNTIAWYKNQDGLGDFTDKIIISDTLFEAWALCVKDFDNDNFDDIVYVSFGGDKIVFLKNNNGDGTFTYQQEISTNVGAPVCVIATDIDNDGDYDIVSGNYLGNKVVLFKNDGPGHFGSMITVSDLVSHPTSIFSCDIDGDNDNDIIVASESGDKIQLFRNTDGNGTFGAAETVATNIDSPESIFCIDIDNDGDNDVVSASSNDGIIAWYENTDGQGTFDSQQIIAMVNNPQSVFAADIDNDGLNDVVYGAFSDGTAWNKNNGSGNFSSKIIISNSPEIRNVYIADLNNDNNKDIITSSTGDSHLISWYKNIQNGEQCDGFDVSVTVTDNATCGNNNGAAEIDSIYNGSGSYTINWSNSDTGFNADSLSSGMHSVIVSDNTLACSTTKYFTVNSIDGPVITIDNQTNVSCFNGNDGEIEISVSGNNPTVEWSNGDTTTTLDNLVAGYYDVTVTDDQACVTMQTIEITQPEELQVLFTITDATCGNADGSAVANVNGGTSPYTLTWSAGTNTNLQAGSYTLTVTDNNGCENVSSFNISDNESITISIDSIVPTGCGNNGAIYVTINGASGTQTYSWSNGVTSEDLVGCEAGVYTLTVEDGGCSVIKDIEIPSIMPNVQEICIVTVDSLTGNNLVVWEKEPTDNISHYNIYRETSWPGNYQLVDSVFYNDMSEFYDPTADPRVRSWRYKISAVDVCGNESSLSPEHKTIHLTINHGLNGSYNLIWDDYEGFSYSTFYIYRYMYSTGWVMIDSLPNTLHSYTDTPPFGYGLNYVVRINAPNACIPTGTSKAQGGPYSQSTSNIEDDLITHQANNNVSKIKVYPNPNNGLFTLELPNDKETTILAYDIMGKLVYKTICQTKKQQIDIQNLDKGVYVFEVKNANEISNFRIVIQ